MRSWTLERRGERPLTHNNERRLHFHQRARIVKAWRDHFAWMARASRIPKLDRVTITATPHYRSRRSLPDVGAVAPAVKAGVDGLVDAGVLDDDNAKHVVGILYAAPVVDGWDGLALTIEEAT